VAETFRKFQQGSVKDYRIKFTESKEMNHIEAKILEFVSLLYPEIFHDLDDFCVRHAEYVDRIIGRFDREIQFYISYLDYMAPLRSVGLRFCYPEFAVSEKEIFEEDGFDLALAAKLAAEKRRAVCNEFHLNGPERIFIVSGPNQGGKTTFARTFGQLHHLARLGLPVPGSRAKLFLCDSIYVHFERPENLKDMHGKLQDDLLRIRKILEKATPRSIIIMNEIFTSTTLKDASFLSRRILDRIVTLDCLCVCVTFLEELSRLNEKTVSMVSTVVPENPAERTYKVIRRPADGRAYAASVAEKYGLTYERLKARLCAGAEGGHQQ
jgi:DNA mismatch repair protein MutS